MNKKTNLINFPIWVNPQDDSRKAAGSGYL